MKVLVTGGAGFVGSIVAEELLRDGFDVLVLDNLQQGHKQAVPRGADFVCADIRDREALERVFKLHKPEAVFHMAAETVVEFSITDPSRYFINNIAGGLNLLEVMRVHDVDRFIFSSSAAVYGEPKKAPITESHPKNPVNSYGETKLMFERVLIWYGKAYGLKHISFRYFNAAGASLVLGEDHSPETHLIPNVLKAAAGLSKVSVFGADYLTKDGSCIRDYVHVVDIARAHVLALKRLNERSGKAYNLGNGQGYSVLEVIEASKKITGRDVPFEIKERRSGDPSVLVASSKSAKNELGWEPSFTEIESIIETAWNWMKRYPKGYGG